MDITLASDTSYEIQMLSLKLVGLESKIASEAKRWISSMTPAQDHEDGPDFWRWIEEHNQRSRVESSNLLDTYLFCIGNSEVVATISVVDDDRGVGRLYTLPGPWIGGANVKAEFRGQGIGSIAFSLLDSHLSESLPDDGQDIYVNLFTNEAAAISIMRKHQYSYQRNLEIPYFRKSAQWWRKTFVAAQGVQ